MNRKNNSFLEPGIRLRLQELIADNFKNEEIDELGALILKKYDSHEVAGAERHITISRRRAAQLLVEACERERSEAVLVDLIADIDGNQLLGRRVRVEGIEGFFHALARLGYIYNSDRRRIEVRKDDLKSLKNWGSLKDGRDYDVSILSLDIVGNSGMVRQYGVQAMETLSYQLLSYLSRRLSEFDGRLWNWAGDGGILAFALPGHEDRAALCALSIQSSLPVFNASPENPIDRGIELRVAGDTGRIRFFEDTGRIVSDVINYAAHLEKAATAPGCVSLSDTLFEAVNQRISRVFYRAGEFEGRGYATTENRIDSRISLNADFSKSEVVTA